MSIPSALPAAKLARRCDPEQFSFETTAELPDIERAIGQERAARAIDFGIGMAREGYNVFVMGPAGSGRHTLVRKVLAERVAGIPRPSDWVYVNNFAQPHRPIAIALPPGRGSALREDLRQLVEELRATIPTVFEGEEYAAKVEQIDAEFNERHEHSFSELGAEAAEQKVALLRTPTGFSFAPLKNSEVYTPQEFAELPKEEQHRIEAVIAQLQTKLEKLVREVMRWRKERHERIRQLNREMVFLAVGHLVDELRQRYAEVEAVVKYLDSVQQDLIENADDFRKPAEGAPGTMRLESGQEAGLRRYAVNVLVDHSGPDGLPIVFEDNPTFQNLVGRVDHIAHMGTLVTDFNLIKPGALHRANGGYLLLDVLKVLTQPFAWEGLKRALQRGEIRIESWAEYLSLVSTVSLEPEPIPLEVKVVLFGERLHYYLLQLYDPDFRKLFRVAADFDEVIERDEGSGGLFARILATVARRDRLIPLDREAVACAIDQASRLAGDTRKISSDLDSAAELLHEADHWARAAGRERITGEDVRKAIDSQRKRSDRLRERLQEAIVRGTILIDTAGAKVGQINALSVYQVGNMAFAQPTRITATARFGEGRVIDIQREVELGGAIHSKGVLILSSYLASRFSGKQAFALSASLVFEQTYGQVEGDSASLAELCALLSALAEVPIRQTLAVTGSVNQLGEVQAIGAVNEKIEGYFDLCEARGLSGEHGVLIPEANVEHLMLRQDVVAAAEAGRFHVYPVRTVDEAISLLTGIPAGDAQPLEGMAPLGVNERVAARLRDFSRLRRAMAEPSPRRRRAEK
ncbi:MAG: AAA family ATPase [Betaproteobacteria bacterium]|nr:AAA family ATPase [Betaproteobacteria bacterium]